MKKFSFIALSALLCWGLTSCDEYTLPNPPAQSNEQEPVFEADNLQLTSTVKGTIDLPTAAAAQSAVELFSYSLTDFPVSSNLELDGQFSADQDFTEVYNVPLSIDAENFTVNVRAGELQQMFNAVVSKDLVARDVYVRVAAFAVNGSSKVRLGGPDRYYFSGIYNILPEPQANIIEPAYYLVGNFCDWDLSKGIKLGQFEEGNVYDHPLFTAIVEVTEAQVKDGGFTFNLVPESAVKSGKWEGAFGFTDLASTPAGASGNLIVVEKAETDSYTLTTEGNYMVKVNMETRKFNVDLAATYLWAPSYGTSISNFDKMMRLTTKDYIHYQGAWVIKNGGFWLAAQPSNVRGFVYRPDGDTEVIAEDKKSFEGKMVIDPELNTRFAIGTPGLHYVEANVVDLNYKGRLIETISLIGGFNGWNLETAVDLTPDKDSKIWTIEDVEMPEGEFKFCANHSWDVSFGLADGSTTELSTINGANLEIAAGKYTFKLDFTAYPAHIVIEKK